MRMETHLPSTVDLWLTSLYTGVRCSQGSWGILEACRPPPPSAELPRENSLPCWDAMWSLTTHLSVSPHWLIFRERGRESAALAGLRSWFWSSSAHFLISYDLIKIPTTCRPHACSAVCKNAWLSIDKRGRESSAGYLEANCGGKESWLTVTWYKDMSEGTH